MKTAALAFAVLLLSASLRAEFLAGYDKGSGKVWALCENRSEIFVSAQDGQAGRVPLDEYHQASFAPSAGGKTVVQCGNETKIVAVPEGKHSAALADDGWLAPILAAAALAVLSIAVAFVAARVLFSQSWFCKSVEGGRARIVLRAGERMENMVVRDPVAIGYAGGENVYELPALAAGKEWEVSYEIEAGCAEKALPASLIAMVKGKKISMLSQLIAGEETEKNAKGAAVPAARRKVPKAGAEGGIGQEPGAGVAKKTRRG